MTKTSPSSLELLTEPEPKLRYLRPGDVDRRSTFWQRQQWRLEAFAWYSIYWDRFAAMDIEEASDRGARLFSWLGPRVGRSAHRTATRNLRMAFPDWPSDQIEETLRKTWENFGRVAGELPNMHQINEQGDDPRLVVENDEFIRRRHADGKPMVFISGHFANWEVMPHMLAVRMPNIELTYRSLNNPHIDRCIANMRERYGAQNLAAKGIGTREVMRALSEGRSTALMNDQKFREGIATPFFGYDAMTAPGPTRLAHKYKAPLILVSARRTGPARYKLVVQEPLWPDFEKSPEDAIAETVPQISAWVEARVREAPHEWFWQHNRWPKEAWHKAGVV